MQLSRNFSLQELTKSDTARRCPSCRPSRRRAPVEPPPSRRRVAAEPLPSRHRAAEPSRRRAAEPPLSRRRPAVECKTTQLAHIILRTPVYPATTCAPLLKFPKLGRTAKLGLADYRTFKPVRKPRILTIYT